MFFKKKVLSFIYKFFFQVQLGVIPIPRSENPERLKKNIDIFDFHINEEEIGELELLNRNMRSLTLEP